MTVYQRNGKWCFDICQPGSSKRERRVTSAETMAEAEALESQRRLQLGLGRELVFDIPPTAPPKKTFFELFEVCKEIWKSKLSFKKYYLVYATNLARHFGSTPAADIDEDAVIRYKNLRLETLKPNSVRHELDILSQMMRIGVRRPAFGIRFNPTEEVEFPEMEAQRRSMSLDQQNALLSELHRPLAFFIFAILRSGRRPFELKYVTVAEHDLERATLSFVDAKSKKRACLPLLPDLNYLIGELCRGKKPDDLIFTNEKGGPWKFPRRQFFSAQARAGLWDPKDPNSKPFTLYLCRGSFGNLMLDSGSALKVVSVLLNHSNQSTTEKHYLRVTDTAQARELKRFDEILKASAAVTAQDILKNDQVA